MSGAGVPLVDLDQYILGDPGAVSRVGRKGGPVLETVFVAPFLPTRLTAPGSPRMGSVQLLKLVAKYEAANWSLRQGKRKQKNKTKNIYLNKLPNISVWKQAFFRGLKKPCFTGGAGVNSSVSYSPPFKSPYPSGLALHSFYFCRLSTNVPKLRKSTVLVMKFLVRNVFNVWDIGSVHLLCKIGLIVDKVFRSVVTYEGQAEKPERTKEIAGSGRGLSPTYKKTCTEVTQPNPISY